ncbi:peptidoglycan L-alanyl-D-glutamate endopeptidase CwlK [Xanthomonas arboricola]|uniref:M15 family metallopeptidase n=1 Tax=Xanthomonas euroxanthea TaxID=2259622 RepID=UPI00141AD93F|nr:M15 family metallopeptidase [Xanthomonas euroxanthea]NIK06886.1 peptidoglycan L-alanyl-D-glutamate endopeptidase CwlK [Xanthomonas euroxanthea]
MHFGSRTLFALAALLTLSLIGCSTIQSSSAPSPNTSQTWATSTYRGPVYRFFHPKQERVWKGVSLSLREKVEAVLAQLAVEGFDVRPVEGYRSPERQATLLASASGVTSVGAWSSCHNYGLALDAAVFVNGEPNWNLEDPHVMAGYLRFGELSEIVGLNWGGRWTSPKDYPHVELKAECGQAKWAYRQGRKLPTFEVADEEPSSYLLAQALAPSWCPRGTDWACAAWGLEKPLAWNWTTPARVCQATFPNEPKKIS